MRRLSVWVIRILPGVILIVLRGGEAIYSNFDYRIGIFRSVFFRTTSVSSRNYSISFMM